MSDNPLELRDTAVEQLIDTAAVQGLVHEPSGRHLRAALALAHGAGSNFDSPVLKSLAPVLAQSGIAVLRYNLAFRRQRPSGAPVRSAPQDQQSIADALRFLTVRFKCPVFAGGHSYGGRMASMLVAEQPGIADGLLLLSYPLHPPRRPDQMRTSHLPSVRSRSLWIHGTRDPFGSPEEMKAAVAELQGHARLLLLDGAGHDLRKPANWTEQVRDAFLEWFALS